MKNILLLLLLSSCGDSGFYGSKTAVKEIKPIETTPPSSTIEDRSYIFEPSYTDSAFKKAEISFLLDDSRSMDEEINSVKSALINLSSIMIQSGLSLNIFFYKMSELNENLKLDQSQSSGRTKYFDNHLPNKFGKLSITKDSNTDHTKNEIEQILGNLSMDPNFSQEQGLCLTLHHLNYLKSKNLETDTRYITVILSDEDENYGNDSSNCFYRLKEVSGIFGSDKTYYNFKDKDGASIFTQSFQSLHDQIAWASEKSYSWLGIFYDKENSLCTPGSAPNNVHGKTYKQLLELLETLGISHGQADICENDYSNIFQEKLISDTLRQRTYNYPLPEVDVLKVTVRKIISKQFTGNHEVDKSLYSINKNNGIYEIVFKANKIVDNLLDQTVDFKIEYQIQK